MPQQVPPRSQIGIDLDQIRRIETHFCRMNDARDRDRRARGEIALIVVLFVVLLAMITLYAMTGGVDV